MPLPGDQVFVADKSRHADAPLGFECQLSRGGAKTPAPLHAWVPCASPVSFSGLTDGSYLFEVRGRGKHEQQSALQCHLWVLLVMCKDTCSRQ